MINPRIDDILYAAYGKLLDLGVKYAETRKPSKRKQYLDQAVRIRYYLKALEFRDYLEDWQVNKLLQCLIDISGIQDYPVAPNLPTVDVPTPTTTIIIQGTPGPAGRDGGATDFSSVNVISDTVVDEFSVSDAYAVRWDYIVNGTPQRAGTIIATWTEDGANIGSTGDLGTEDVNGSTNPVTFNVEYLGGNIRLVAIITSGTWSIAGSRYFIPNNGKGTGPITNQLSYGKIFIGDITNQATEQSVTGDIAISPVGLTSITPNVILNSDVNSAAAIDVSKLAALTASRAVVTNSSGFLTTSSATATEVGYLSGVTSNIQVQLDSKLSGATGAISTVVSVDLTASRVVISNPSGKIAASGVTTTELNYLSGVTSAIQTQLDGKVTADDSLNIHQKIVELGDWNMDSTAGIIVSVTGITASTIRSITGTVRTDSGSLLGETYYAFSGYGAGNAAGAEPELHIAGWSPNGSDTDVVVRRVDSSAFDSVSFDATGYNRGWLVITYAA